MQQFIFTRIMIKSSFILMMVFSIIFTNAQGIEETTAPKGWIIATHSSAYQLIVDANGNVKPVFYGPVAEREVLTKNASWFSGVDEVPVRGSFPNKTPMLEVVFGDNVRDLDLVFVKGEIMTIDGKPALKITQKDRFYPLEVHSFIRVVGDEDILEKWCEVKNTGNREDIRVENLQSGSIVLPANRYQLTHMAGKWGSEFQVQQTDLTPGIKTLQAIDFKSMTTPAWFLLRPQGEHDVDKGSAWFGTIQYSGNWRIDFNDFFDGNVQVTAGIHFWDTWLNLKPGTSFQSPKFITGFTNQGSEKAAQLLQAYVRTQVLPVAHRNDLRPVLYNSWYATEFGVNEEQQLALARKASEAGVELFVIDDGWFKGRITDKAGLGDWEVDRTKFPNGLSSMIKKINEMGMDFGIWIEPEMVNPNSDLYRAHPDWVLSFPNRKHTEHRNQQMLNLAREDVYQYLLRSFSKLLSENNIRFIKWDHNRTLTEPGWSSAPAGDQREVRIRYIANLYRLVDALKKQFPQVWFENCSSGGGRADYGMMSRMDQAWVSDNTDPVSRLFIQYGYLNFLPANTMVSWVTRENKYQEAGLDYKFDVCMSGVLGIGNDLTQWGDSEMSIAKQKVALYKQVRPLVQQGTAFRLISPFEENRSATQYVSQDSSSAVVFCYNMAQYLPQSKMDTRGSQLLLLKGLEPGKKYRIRKPGMDEKKQDQHIYTGDFLMNVGIGWPVSGSFKSQVLLVSEERS